MHWTLQAVGRGIQRALGSVRHRVDSRPEAQLVRLAQELLNLPEQEQAAAPAANAPGSEEDAGKPPSSEPGPLPPPPRRYLGLNLPPDQIEWAAEWFGPMPGGRFMRGGEEEE